VAVEFIYLHARASVVDFNAFGSDDRHHLSRALASSWLSPLLALEIAGGGRAAASQYGAGLIGMIRRECVDHLIVFGEAHLRRILREYAAYYNGLRTHRALNQDAPVHRAVEPIGAITS
jgi:hypothetical protein